MYHRRKLHAHKSHSFLLLPYKRKYICTPVWYWWIYAPFQSLGPCRSQRTEITSLPTATNKLQLEGHNKKMVIHERLNTISPDFQIFYKSSMHSLHHHGSSRKTMWHKKYKSVNIFLHQSYMDIHKSKYILCTLSSSSTTLTVIATYILTLSPAIWTKWTIWI